MGIVRGSALAIVGGALWVVSIPLKTLLLASRALRPRRAPMRAR